MAGLDTPTYEKSNSPGSRNQPHGKPQKTQSAGTTKKKTEKKNGRAKKCEALLQKHMKISNALYGSPTSPYQLKKDNPIEGEKNKDKHAMWDKQIKTMLAQLKDLKAQRKALNCSDFRK